MKMKKIVMKRKPEDKIKHRAPILVSKRHQTKVQYKRKPKHKGKTND